MSKDAWSGHVWSAKDAKGRERTRKRAAGPVNAAVPTGCAHNLSRLPGIVAFFAPQTPVASVTLQVLVALALLLGICFAPTIAHAQSGGVFEAAGGGIGGLQMDAAALSPAPAGDKALPAAGPLTSARFYPWPPKQGQTVAVWFSTAAPISLTLSFGGVPCPVFADGRHGWALLPIPPLTPTGTLSFVITGTQNSAFVSETLPVPVAAGTFEMSEVPAETSDPIMSQTGKVQAEVNQLTALWSRIRPSAWTPRSRFATPLAPAQWAQAIHTAPFGSRRIYGDSPAVTAHAGEDLAIAAGTPVVAPAAGVVVLAEPLWVRGNAVIIDHGQGVFTGYWHLSAIDVHAGDAVTAGQKVGEVGTTGLSTGPHLHWEMEVNGVAVDPLQWLVPPAD
jgi:biotin carboxyl carrier protein